MRVFPLLFLVLGGAACGDGPAGPGPSVATLELSGVVASIVPNEEVLIVATARAAGGTVIERPELEWRSSDVAVATISETGSLKGVAAGTASISVTSGSAVASFVITVDQGAFIGAAGGTISAFAGSVTLVVPAGALATGTAVRLHGISAPPPDPTFVRGSGAAVAFTGTFSVPAQLTLSYNPQEVPVGLAETRLGVRVLRDGEWVPIAGGSVDVAAQRAAGDITAAGTYGVGMRPSSTSCTAPEHRAFDFRLGSFTWAGPGGLSGEAEITAEPSGCSIRETLRINAGPVVRAVFFYEPTNQQWHYTSVDGAAVTRLSGGREGGRMVLYTANRRTRVVWEEVSANAHVQAGESSTDGTTFTRLGAGTYTRKGMTTTTNVVTPAGGRVVLGDGAVTIEAPAGAVAQDVAITASLTPSAVPLDPSLVRGAVWTLTASPPTTFLKPVHITMKYNPSAGPSGVPESDFRLATPGESLWETVTGQVDTLANTVTGAVTRLATFSAHRAPPTAACSAPEHRQFDFWLGEWQVGQTRSSIVRDATGCTIFEHWRAPNPGLSISLYDPRTQQWHQTYVTAGQPQPLVMSGGLEGQRMVMYVRGPQGVLLMRWTWERVDANTVTQRAETTNDNGTTWLPGFTGTYVRR